MSTTREELLRELEQENRISSADGVLYFQALAQRSGMNLTDLQCITILTSTGFMTAGQLAERMGLTTGAITGLVNRMEQAGYVRREKDPGDARRVVIHPVMEALERVGAGFLSEQEGVLEALTADFDDRALALLVDFMRKANVFTREEIARIRAIPGADDSGDLAAPLGTTTSGRLLFTNGALRLALRGDAGMDDLYRAHFAGGGPKVEAEGGTVTVRNPRRFKLFSLHADPGEIVLNASIPWAIEVRGGAYRVDWDLRALSLSSLDVKTGISDVTLALPEPSGRVPVRLMGGAHNVRITRPANTQARVAVKGGFHRFTFDQNVEAMGIGERFQTAGFDAASDRYDVEISGGANEVTIQ